MPCVKALPQDTEGLRSPSSVFLEESERPTSQQSVLLFWKRILEQNVLVPLLKQKTSAVNETERQVSPALLPRSKEAGNFPY